MENQDKNFNRYHTFSELIPKYKSHKTVRAGKIIGFTPDTTPDTTPGTGAGTFLELEKAGNVFVTNEYCRKHDPQIGGYYVVYEDGYESWSPAEAFESGYVLVNDTDKNFDIVLTRSEPKPVRSKEELATLKQVEKALFDDIFKFKIHQDLRHKADNKDGHSADMGLLVLERTLIESEDDDGGKIFERYYHCRMIKFAGSGEITRFKESELITMEEYARKKVEDEEFRTEVRNEMHIRKETVFKSFGVKRGTEVWLKKEGTNDPDTTTVYEVSGYESDKNGTRLTLSAVYGQGQGQDRKKVTSSNEFIIKE